MLHDLLAKAEQLLNKRLGWLQKWSKTAEGHRETDFFFVRGDEAQQDGSAGGRHAHPRSRLADDPFGGRPPSTAAAVAASSARRGHADVAQESTGHSITALLHRA